MYKYPEAVLVREQALAMIHISARTVQVLHKVVGISDYLAWIMMRSQFDEIHPKTVKRLLTQQDDASKTAVAKALIPYVGEQEWKTDDESDACAVGIAWLLQRNMIPVKKRAGRKEK